MSESDVAAIITLSSDEEETNEKKKKTTAKISKKEAEDDDEMDLNKLAQKRPLSPGETGCPSKKRAKLTTVFRDNKKIPENELSKSPFPKPGLIERERRPVIESSEDIFTMFISQCLQRERSPTMQKIITKLKRRYEQLDSSYSESPEFKKLLVEKREALAVADKLLYTHISEIYDEMKNRKRGKESSGAPSQEEASTSDQQVEPIDDSSSCENKEKEKKTERKIRLIIASMEKCKKLIKKYDEAEVNWDDENNSDYMKADKYKERMMQLHCKLCELTGERKDAKRAYLKPKHFKVTKIDSVDQAINSFINKNLKNKTNNARSMDSVIFPDYLDILNCIKKCNDEEKLAMSTEAMKALAKSSFEELGQALQKERQMDYFDTFSMLIEKDNDPAKSNPELREKLELNRKTGDQNMKKMIDDHVLKQEEARIKGDGVDSNNGGDDEDKEEEEEEEEDVEVELDDDDDDDELAKDLSEEDENFETNVERLDDDTYSDVEMENEVNEVEIEEKPTETKEKIEVKKVETTVSNLATCIGKISVEKNEEKSFDIIEISTDVVDNLASEKINKLSKESTLKIIVDSSEIVNKLEREKLDPPDITKQPPTPDSTTPEPHNTATEVEVIDDEEMKTNSDESPEIDKTRLPILKLRSFAKPPEFWQNSQDEEAIASTLNESIKSIELVTLDDTIDDDNSIQELPQPDQPKRLKSSSVITLSAVKNPKIIPLSSAILKTNLQLNPMANRAIIQAKNKTKNGTAKLQKVPLNQIITKGVRQSSSSGVQVVLPGSVLKVLRPTQTPAQTIPAPRQVSKVQVQIPHPTTALRTLAPRSTSTSSLKAVGSTIRTASSIQSVHPPLTKTQIRSSSPSSSITRHLPPTTIRVTTNPPATKGAVGNYGYHTSPIKSFLPRVLGTIASTSSTTTTAVGALSRVAAIKTDDNKYKLVSVVNRANGTVSRRVIKNINNTKQ